MLSDLGVVSLLGPRSHVKGNRSKFMMNIPREHYLSAAQNSCFREEAQNMNECTACNDPV